MRISVWSSDVCSSDLIPGDRYRSVSATQPILGAGGPADGRPTMTKAVHCDGDRSCFDVLEGLGQFGREFGIFGTETRSEEHTSELQSLMRISYAVFCLKKKKNKRKNNIKTVKKKELL